MIKAAAVASLSSFILAVAASTASAQAPVWTLDAMSLQQIRAAAAADQAAFPAPKQTRLYAESLGSAVLPQRFGGSMHPQLWLKLNNTKDRAGAEYSVCSGYEGDDCAYLNFVFPELTVDREQKVVRWGEDVVANWRSRWHGLRLEKGFTLRSELVESVQDTGFDRVKVTRVRVYLERR